MLTFGSLFAGIGGFDSALESAGCRSAWQVEINADANKVLERHWPSTERFTDVCDFGISAKSFRPDIIGAGWPCQGNSVAGKRAGMAHQGSGLWSEVVRILDEFRPTWFLGENVPGLLSVNGGRDFGAVLRDLAELGYGFAYRILDAQWFGVPQRRRRIFIVGCLGDWQSAAEILFESECLPWDSPPSRQAGQRIAASLTRGADSGGKGGYAGRRREDDVNLVARSVTTREGQRMGCDQDTYIASPITGFPRPRRKRTTGHEQIRVVIADLIQAKADIIAGSFGVRRLTPVECLRLQGFPDDWLDDCGLSDSSKYRLIGNSVARPCVEWIGRRIVDAARLSQQLHGEGP